MPTIVRNLFTAALLLPLLAVPPARAEAVDLRRLVRQVEEQYNGNASHLVASMHIVTAQWERSLRLEAWSLGRGLCLTRILAPAKERGVGTLKEERQVWNYLPRIDRVIKIPSSMMGAAWMGSHITNDDLVKANHVDLDYNLALDGETDDDWRIACTPRPGVPVVWGRIVYTIRRADSIPLEVDYFDDAGQKVRTVRFEDVQHVGTHVLPLRMIVQPEDTPDERTVLQYEQITFDPPLTAAFFSLQRLKAP